ncbi:MAG: T9SS type A sorting domain-containing protein [Flavobacteriales bacterium]
MNPYTTILGVSFVIFFFEGFGQQTVLSSGGDINAASGSVSYSIGQVSYEHIDGPAGTLYEGVQQPYELFVVSIDESMLDVSFALFPNPTRDYITISMEHFQDGLSMAIFDLQGQLMMDTPLLHSNQALNVQHWAPSSYIVRIRNSSGAFSEFIFIKN